MKFLDSKWKKRKEKYLFFIHVYGDSVTDDLLSETTQLYYMKLDHHKTNRTQITVQQSRTENTQTINFKLQHLHTHRPT